MATFPEKVTDETVEQAWEWVAEKYRGAKRRFAVEAPVSWIADALFFAGAVLLCLGVIMEDLPVAKPYAESLPWVLDLWSRYKAWLFGLEIEPGQMQLLTAGLLFLVPALCCVPIAAAVKLAYHPKAPAAPTGNRKERAWALVDTARIARIYTRKASHNSTVFFAAVFGLSVFAFLAYVLFGSAYEGIQLTATDFDTSTKIGFWIMGVFFVYGALCYLVRLLTLPLYYFRIPNQNIAELERYWREVSAVETDEPAAES